MANKAIKFKNYEGQHYEVKLRKPRKEVKASGICYPPENVGVARILVNPHQSEEDIAETIIHEISHAFFWGTSEDKIAYFAKTLSQILNKLN